MDNIEFYQPPSTSRRQAPSLPGTVTASHLSLGPIVSLPARKTAMHVKTILHEIPTLKQDFRNDKQGKFIVSQNLPSRSADDDYDCMPGIEELLSGTPQKTLLPSSDPNADSHDGFVDIDNLLSDMQQKGPTSVDPDYYEMANIVDSGTRGGSPTDSSRSTAGSSRDQITLSDDESAGIESETGYSDFDVDVRAKTYSESLRNMADGSGSGAALISDSNRSATGHQDGDNNPNGVIEQTPPRLSANYLTILSLNPESESHRASKLLLSTNSTQQNTSSVNLDVVRKISNYLPAPFDKNRALDNAVSKLQDGHVEDTRVPQLVLAATSPHQSDFKNGLRKRLRRGGLGDVRRKRPHTAAFIKPAITDLIELKSRIQMPDEEGELGLANEEQNNNSCANESDDEDYSDMSKAASSSKGGSLRSRKRVKRATNTEPSDIETPPTRSLNNSRQAIAATSSSGIQESEEIPILGYLTLKNMESKVVYCLTFSQQLSPELSNLSLNPEALVFSSNESLAKAAVIVNDSKEYVVERILGKRQKKLRGRGLSTRLEYRVKWQGYAKPTWEPATSLEDTVALDDYLENGKGSNIKVTSVR